MFQIGDVVEYDRTNYTIIRVVNSTNGKYMNGSGHWVHGPGSIAWNPISTKQPEDVCLEEYRRGAYSEDYDRAMKGIKP